MSLKNQSVYFFRKMNTHESEYWNSPVLTAWLVVNGQSLKNSAKVLNISSQMLIFDLGIVSDLFSRYFRRGGAIKCKKRLKLCRG